MHFASPLGEKSSLDSTLYGIQEPGARARKRMQFMKSPQRIRSLGRKQNGNGPGSGPRSGSNGNGPPALKADSGPRIAWVTPSLERGYFMQPLFREFTKRFPGTLVFTGCWPGFVAGCRDSFRVRELSGVGFRSSSKPSAGNPRGVITVSPRVFLELWKFRPQLVFVRGFDLCTIYAILLKVLTRCSLVLLWGGVGPHVTFPGSPVRLALRRLTARWFDYAVSHTKDGADYLRDVIEISPRQLSQYPYQPADRGTLSFADRGNGTSSTLPRPVFLYVGRLIREKGLYTLLEACSLLTKEEAGDFSITIVGQGPEKARLQAVAQTLEIDGRIRWAGAVDYSQLGACYQASDVFVFPSLEDIIGMVVPEAMVFGKPVLCSDQAGAKDMVRHGGNGFVFDPYDARQLAGHMARFVKEPELIRRFGAESKRIISPFTPQACAQRLGSIVDQVLGATTDGASRGVAA